MDAIITQVQSIAATMQNVKEDYRRAITKHSRTWEGPARRMFDKKSAQLLQTLTDVSQSFYEIGEDLLKASQAYMEQDTANAKVEAGTQNRF